MWSPGGSSGGRRWSDSCCWSGRRDGRWARASTTWWVCRPRSRSIPTTRSGRGWPTSPPDDLAAPFLDRQLVRVVAMRGTIHLLTAANCLGLRHLVQPILDEELTRHSQHRHQLVDLDLGLALDFARGFLAEPRSLKQLKDGLAAELPDLDAPALAYACRNHLVLVRVSRPAGPCRSPTPRLRPSWAGRSTPRPPSTTWCCATWRPSDRPPRPTSPRGRGSRPCARWSIGCGPGCAPTATSGGRARRHPTGCGSVGWAVETGKVGQRRPRASQAVTSSGPRSSSDEQLMPVPDVM